MTDQIPSGAAANGHGPDVDFKALLRSSRRAERTVPICLRGDLVAEFEELDRQLGAAAARAAARPNDQRLNNPAVSDATRLAEQMATLQDEMRASTVDFRLRALSPKRWAELQGEYPPRKGEDGKVKDSDVIGVNAETFFEPLVRESLVSPVLDDEDWEILMGRAEPTEDDPDRDKRGLSDALWDALAGAAWNLNRRGVDIPFSSAASRILRTSATNSTPPSE